MPLNVAIQKTDSEQQLVYGEVYAPSVPDSQGDFMSAHEIQKMAHGFMKNLRARQVDKEHDNQNLNAYVAESFIARDGDPDFIPGSWVIGMHVVDEVIWNMVKSGEINGFSLEARAVRTPAVVEVEMPEEVEGVTSVADDHEHTFVVRFDDEGQFMGGYTDEVDGHFHEIRTGTATEKADGHSHRFSFLEALG